MKTRARKLIFIPISLLLIVSSYAWAADKAVMLYPVLQNRKYGYMNRRGKIVIEPKFDYAWSFSEGLAGIVIDRKGGYVDPKGNIVIQPLFDRAWPFSDGLALVTIKRKGSYIDKAGQYAIYSLKQVIDRDGALTDSTTTISLSDANKFYSEVQAGSTIRVPKQFKKARRFSDGLARVAHQGKGGYIDTSGAFAIEPKYFAARDFSEGLAPVRVVGNLWGYIDKNEEFVIEPRFWDAGDFSEGLAPAQESSAAQWGYIDKKGDFIILARYRRAEPFSEGMAAVKFSNDMFGYIDLAGRLAIPATFDRAYPFLNGLARVKVGRKYGYINNRGAYVWKPTE